MLLQWPSGTRKFRQLALCLMPKDTFHCTAVKCDQQRQKMHLQYIAQKWEWLDGRLDVWCETVVIRYHGWLAGCQLTFDTSKTAAALLSQRLLALGYSKDDLTFHCAVYVFYFTVLKKEYLDRQYKDSFKCWLQLFLIHFTYLHCALSLAAQCIVIGPVCGGRVWVCVFVGLLPR